MSRKNKTITFEISNLIPRLVNKTIRRGRKTYKYKALLVEVYGRKLDDNIKALLSKVKVKAKLVLEIELPETKKIIEPKRFEIEAGIYFGYLQFLSCDMDTYEVWKVVVRENSIKFSCIARGYGYEILDEVRSLGRVPRIWDLELMQVLREIDDYIDYCLYEKQACPLCGHELFSFSRKGRYEDDYTIINRGLTGYSKEIHEEYYFICPHCGLEIRDKAYTWDARSVLNWELEIRYNDKVYECSKIGITDDNTLFRYYKVLAKFAVESGLLKVKVNEPYEALNCILPLFR